MRILVLHGPNLNLLGRREPETYGTTTLAEIDGELRELATGGGHEVVSFQSNDEGELISKLQEAMEDFDGVLLNPGGLTHTSVALLDAVLAVPVPVVEVHLSNIYAREEFRRRSVIAQGCVGCVAGFGPRSYVLAFEAMVGVES